MWKIWHFKTEIKLTESLLTNKTGWVKSLHSWQWSCETGYEHPFTLSKCKANVKDFPDPKLDIWGLCVANINKKHRKHHHSCRYILITNKDTTDKKLPTVLSNNEFGHVTISNIVTRKDQFKKKGVEVNRYVNIIM